ncbi:MAG: hypothetical protein ABSA50_06835 [Candidatus Bathyarchaeia archaeon]|jgi:hypothetical protein
MGDEKFEIDLGNLLTRLIPDKNGSAFTKLDAIKAKLVRMHDQNLVKINHSAMEIICAKDLIMRGYDVDVEHRLEESLVCDLLGIKGDGRAIVEIETGFVPPEHALDPTAFCSAKIASKIARYSKFADKFTLASPLYQILPIPLTFLKPPRVREPEEVRETKRLCDRYYDNPPIPLNEITTGRLHSLSFIDVDAGTVREVDPETYAESLLGMWDKIRQ